jgi:hypothetical protein
MAIPGLLFCYSQWIATPLVAAVKPSLATVRTASTSCPVFLATVAVPLFVWINTLLILRDMRFEGLAFVRFAFFPRRDYSSLLASMR